MTTSLPNRGQSGRFARIWAYPRHAVLSDGFHELLIEHAIGASPPGYHLVNVLPPAAILLWCAGNARLPSALAACPLRCIRSTRIRRLITERERPPPSSVLQALVFLDADVALFLSPPGFEQKRHLLLPAALLLVIWRWKPVDIAEMVSCAHVLSVSPGDPQRAAGRTHVGGRAPNGNYSSSVLIADARFGSPGEALLPCSLSFVYPK